MPVGAELSLADAPPVALTLHPNGNNKLLKCISGLVLLRDDVMPNVVTKSAVSVDCLFNPLYILYHAMVVTAP